MHEKTPTGTAMDKQGTVKFSGTHQKCKRSSAVLNAGNIRSASIKLLLPLLFFPIKIFSPSSKVTSTLFKL
jgi:hypothetical protein